MDKVSDERLEEIKNSTKFAIEPLRPEELRVLVEELQVCRSVLKPPKHKAARACWKLFSDTDPGESCDIWVFFPPYQVRLAYWDHTKRKVCMREEYLGTEQPLAWKKFNRPTFNLHPRPHASESRHEIQEEAARRRGRTIFS